MVIDVQEWQFAAGIRRSAVGAQHITRHLHCTVQNCVDPSALWTMRPAVAQGINALYRVMDLHVPNRQGVCDECSGRWRAVAWPCPTWQAVAVEFERSPGGPAKGTGDE